MSKSIFITGTDTNVGKTVITAGILRHLRYNALDAVSMKPVQTGADLEDGVLRAPDLVFHHAATNLAPSRSDLDAMAPYLYEPACSPHLAGRMAGFYPDIQKIKDAVRVLEDHHETVLVEGAGGVMTPVNETATMLDLMKALSFPVILVAHRGLGTINHSLLSIAALRAAQLDILGIVFNEIQDVERDFIKKDNPGAVKSYGGIRVLGDVDYLPLLPSNPESAWQRFEECVPGLEFLLSGLHR